MEHRLYSPGMDIERPVDNDGAKGLETILSWNHFMRWLAAAACLAACSAPRNGFPADPPTVPRAEVPSARFLNRTFRDKAGEHHYVVSLPPGYSADRKWPVILFLHGAGERGTDGRRPTEVGLGPILKSHAAAFPAIVVFPQAEELHDRILTTWNPDHPDGARALNILAAVEAEFPCDARRRILTGWSMGGYGAWNVAAASEPGHWSAVLALSSGDPGEAASRLPADLPFWAIHGADDSIVRESDLNRAVETARAAGRDVSATTIAGVGHDVWKVAYAAPEVQQWLFDPRSVDPASVRWSAEETARLIRESDEQAGPFVAGTKITHAVAVRIDNAAFAQISRGIPAAIPRERLAGELPDIVREFDYDGTTIRATIHSIHWSTEVESVQIVAAGAEELRVTVQLRNLTLRPEGADVRGGAYRASTGPFDIVIAPWKPVAVRTVLRPQVIDGAIVLTPREIDFRITDDNWFVREPEFAAATGPDLTPELVKVGVVGGLYRSRSEVEQTVQDLIPGLIKRVEERLAIVPPASVASMLWPLPTQPPAIRLLPEAIRTDRDGVSATLALVVARGPASERSMQRAMTSPIVESAARGVSIGLAPGVVEALAEEFRRTNESHIDVLDIPESTFARLASPELLLRAAPDLARFAERDEFRTELQLAAPFELRLVKQTAGDPAQVAFRIVAPRLLLNTYRRPKGGFGQGVPCLQVEFALDQKLDVTLEQPTEGGRPIRIDWDRHPEITGTARFPSDHQPEDGQVDPKPLLDAVEEAWTAWTASMPSVNDVPDFAVGQQQLRLDALPVAGGRIWFRFDPLPKDEDETAHGTAVR